MVAILTRDPAEFPHGASTNLAASATYSGRDDSTSVSGSFAVGGDRISGVVHAWDFNGHERVHSAEADSDPLERDKRSFMAKAAYALPSGNRLVLGVAGLDEQVDSEIVSMLGSGRRYRNTTSLLGDDERRRLSANLNYEFASTAEWLEAGRLTLYAQDTQVEKNTFEIRGAAPTPGSIERRFDYDTTIYGIGLDLERELGTGTLAVNDMH